MTRPLGMLVLVLGFSAVPAGALAWKRSAEFEANVHKHRFTNVAIESDDCVLRYRLDFVATPEAYPAQAKGYYRFHARLKLQDGRAVTTPFFGNRAPGKRTYSNRYDTTSEGCWAKQDHKLFGVDVEGCKGWGCTPEPFR